MKYDRTTDRTVGHDYPGSHGQGIHQFLLDEMELGARAAMALDDPEQAWWEIRREQVARDLAELAP